MKTNLLLLSLTIMLSFTMYPQEEKTIIKGGNYYLDPIITLTQQNFKTTTNNSLNVNEFKGKGYKFTVKNIVEDKVYFKFWKFTEDNDKINGIDNSNVYEVTKDDFLKLTSPLYNRIDWRAGFFNVPFKLRFSDFDFTSNVNLGINIGARTRWNRVRKDGFSIEPVFGFGISSISLDESNSNVEESTNSSAFSINTGVLFHISKNINLGVLYGFDNLSAKDQNKYNWKYNGKRWLGLGINVSFSVGGDNSGSAGNNKKL